MDEGIASYMPEKLRKKIQNEYKLIAQQGMEEINPVKKVPLVVTGHDKQIHIDEIHLEGDDNIANNAASYNQQTQAQYDNQLQLATYGKLNGLEHLIWSQQTEI